MPKSQKSGAKFESFSNIVSDHKGKKKLKKAQNNLNGQKLFFDFFKAENEK